VGDRGFGDIRTRMRRALTAAMKARDRSAVTALRSALAAIDNAEAVDPANTPPATARQPGPGKAPPGEGRLPTAKVPSAGDGDPPGKGRIAGAALGVGAAEAERLTLTPAETQAIVREEVTERQAAADAYERGTVRARRAPACRGRGAHWLPRRRGRQARRTRGLAWGAARRSRRFAALPAGPSSRNPPRRPGASRCRLAPGLGRTCRCRPGGSGRTGPRGGRCRPRRRRGWWRGRRGGGASLPRW
jgi:uncharacterized protein